MSVPKYNELMLPLLQYASDGEEHHVRNASEAIAEHLQLTEDQVNELLENGRDTRFYYRVRWAKTYLTKACLIERTGRGTFRITQRGFDVLATNPTEITEEILYQFPEFVEFKTPNTIIASTPSSITTTALDEQETPEEQIETTYKQLRKGLIDDLLETVISVSPAFFERVVVDLLLAMGYGGALGSGETIGRSGDGGVDGIIREDKLGLDSIYIQAKRYAPGNGVGRPEIQGFVGSLMGLGANKGVFITTSYFSQQAIQYAQSLQNLKVILIDGDELANLMIEHNVGVSVQKTYVIKQVDENYFPD